MLVVVVIINTGLGSLHWGSLPPAIFVFLITTPDISFPETNRSPAHLDFLCLTIQCKLLSMEWPWLLLVAGDAVDPNPNSRGAQVPSSGGIRATWFVSGAWEPFSNLSMCCRFPFSHSSRSLSYLLQAESFDFHSLASSELPASLSFTKSFHQRWCIMLYFVITRLVFKLLCSPKI